MCLLYQYWRVRGKQVLGIHWPASLANLASSKLERDLVSATKVARTGGMTPEVVLSLHTHTHPYIHTHTQK